MDEKIVQEFTPHQKTDVIPELVIKRDTIFLHKEDIERVLMDKLPGHIADLSGGAQMPGCRLILFTNAGIKGLPPDVYEYFQQKTENEQYTWPVQFVNKFFELFANYVLIKIFPDGHGNIVVEYTAMLNEEDTKDLQEVSGELRKAMNEKRAKRNADIAEAEAKAKELNDKLMEVAKGVVERGGYTEFINDLQSQINVLAEENKKLKRKARK